MAETVIHVTQGRYRISDRPGDVLCTVLGSCIAACLHDPVRRIGGMNHFLLPGADPSDTGNVKYGAHAMEQLINALLRAGADRGRLEAQIYGGANTVPRLGRIGDGNAAFARDFMACEALPLRAADTGGTAGRRLCFDPVTGLARVKVIAPDLPELNGNENRASEPPDPATGIEFF